MLILAIDTSSASGSIAVARDTELLGVTACRSPEGFSIRLFREVESLTAGLGFSLDDIELYAVNAGPGSFTGLRVGLTAVKAWAEVYQKPIAAISGLAAVAAQSGKMTGETTGAVRASVAEGTPDRGSAGLADRMGAGDHIIPMLDARRGQIYGGVYRRTTEGLEARGEDCVMAASEFLRELHKRLGSGEAIFVTPDPEILRAPLKELEFSRSRVEIASPVLAPWIAQLGLVKARRGDCVDALQLEANYIRQADAELSAELGAGLPGAVS
jgi:tRNA threonylcarbamoyladenosine biosynthesis protein TsaB